jgi:hypothetical protein
MIRRVNLLSLCLAACRLAPVIVVLAMCASLTAQTGNPAKPPGKEKPAIQRAIDALTEEAQQAKKNQKMPRTETDFAAGFKDEIPTDALLEAITQPVNRDSFIDGYVRWQLTGFNPPLPALDERQMLKLMAAAPAILPNPCADVDVVATFEKAEEASQLSQRDRERLRETWTTINDRRRITEAFNLPALGWRKWIDNQLPSRGPAKILWLIERVAGTVNGGWDSRTVKGDLTRLSRDLGRSVGDLALSPQQTQLVCEQIQRMKGLRRRMIEDIAFLASNRIDVSFFNLYVSESDIEKWVESLGGTVQP